MKDIMEMSEDQVQEALIDYCDLKKYPCYHVPNGGYRSKSEAKRFKRMGVRPGIPDLVFPVAKRGFHGLYVELKTKKGKPTDKQLEWQNTLNVNGYKAIICYGFDEAKETIDWYMAGD